MIDESTPSLVKYIYYTDLKYSTIYLWHLIFSITLSAFANKRYKLEKENLYIYIQWKTGKRIKLFTVDYTVFIQASNHRPPCLFI